MAVGPSARALRRLLLITSLTSSAVSFLTASSPLVMVARVWLVVQAYLTEHQLHGGVDPRFMKLGKPCASCHGECKCAK